MKNILTFFTLILLYMIGCSSKQDPEKEIKSVIYDNIKASEEKNIIAYMATIHPNAEYYSLIRDQTEKIFSEYNIEYELRELTILSVAEDESKVQFTIVTKKISGPELNNTKSIAICILKKHDGKWKIFSTKITDFSYLNNDKNNQVDEEIENSRKAVKNRDALMADLNNLAEMVQQYYRKPQALGGGGNSFIGWSIPENLKETNNGSYSVEVSSELVILSGIGTIVGMDKLSKTKVILKVSPNMVQQTTIIN